MKSPAFQFYPNDFLGGVVATYSLEEIGLYMSLLAFDWNLNGLPTEAEKLAKMTRVSARKFRSLWAVVGENFVERDGRYHNPRLDLERAKQEENRAKKKAAADSRWNADAYADAMHLECSPSSTPSSTPETATAKQTSPRKAAVVRVADDDPRFAAVWAIYPPRSGGNPRKEAFAAWRARIRAGVPPEVLHAGLERYRAYCEAKGWVGTEYVSQARTFFGPSDRYLEPWTLPVAGGRVVVSSAGDDAAWSALQDVVAKLARNQINADEYRALPAPLQAGLRAVGGWSAFREARPSDIPFRKRDFLAAYRAAEMAGAA